MELIKLPLYQTQSLKAKTNRDSSVKRMKGHGGLVKPARSPSSGETQEDLSQDGSHSVWNFSATVSCHDNPQQTQEKSHQKEKPKVYNEAVWRDLNEDLGATIETSLKGCEEKRIKELTTLVHKISGKKHLVRKKGRRGRILSRRGTTVES
ncbi:hypothetical protein ScPMuIL_015878 [Solemya velum]